MRVLVTGAGGMLGREVMKSLAQRGHEAIGKTHHDLEITDREMVWDEMGGIRPDAVIHCAAMTNVDGCERELGRAFEVNAIGASHVASAANAIGATLAYISTDFVFDGEKGEGYTEFDEPNPINEYGRSKLWGERYTQWLCPRHFIVRSAWLFGFGRRNFVSSVAKRLSTEGEVKAVTDQVGSPTFTRDLARMLCLLIETDAFGIYHVVNQGSASRFELARKIAAELKFNPDEVVKPITSDQWPTPARRPRCSTLKSIAWKAEGFPPLRHFSPAVGEYLTELKERGEL